jgi:transposase InsO family protein
VVVDEWTRECLSIDVARQLGSDDVLERLSWLMATRGVPDHVRSDNGSEFTAKAVRAWLGKVGVKTLSIAAQPLGERLRGEPQRQAA